MKYRYKNKKNVTLIYNNIYDIKVNLEEIILIPKKNCDIYINDIKLCIIYNTISHFYDDWISLKEERIKKLERILND